MNPDALDQNLTNYCYKNLKEWIIRGDYAPGEKLLIAKLKERLKVGPTPIREALSRLTSSGLIFAEENKGFRVKPISESEIRDLYQTFNQIECLALRQAIELGDTAWEAGIVASLYKLSIIEKSSPVDSSSWLQRNYEFHYSLISGCNSPYLLKVREDLYQHFDRYCHLGMIVNKKSLVLNHQEHAEIAKAAIERNPDKACELIALHLKGSLEMVLEKLIKNS